MQAMFTQTDKTATTAKIDTFVSDNAHGFNYHDNDDMHVMERFIGLIVRKNHSRGNYRQNR